jgi:hypothetical protein
MDIGIQQAKGSPISTPLPISWLGRADAPNRPPSWANINVLSSTQVRNLEAQIGYDKSAWNYNLIGPSNELGRYQIPTTTLEAYGLLAPGSNTAYGINCVNYKACWKPVTIRSTNSYANYLYNVSSLNDFLTSTISQDHLMYQIIYDLYNSLLQNTAIQTTDTADIIAGMIYVAVNLGAGNGASISDPAGTGAYTWRFSGIGLGTNPYNSGRYAITVLSQ